jgi:cytochrome c oxidase subunit 1
VLPLLTVFLQWNYLFCERLRLYFFFISGGVSGMYVANAGMDILFHDTFYVIGHFHIMFAGSGMIAVFAAYYFYFPAMYGVKYSRIYAYIHYIYFIIGQLMTVIPML